MQKKLVQHIETTSHPATSLSIEEFLSLLESEEDYFKGEQHQTNIMVTRLRKIFYDKYGWDTQLIRKAKNIPGRYLVKLVPSDVPPEEEYNIVFRGEGTDYMRREVLVREGDWMNPHPNTVPAIYKDNHQQVVLDTGFVCDIGHVLAGMDAGNNPEPVAPIPTWLMFLHPLFPHVDKNTDASTWLGDLSSVSGDAFFYYLRTKQWPDKEKLQSILDNGAPGPDMLGNIDSYAVGTYYNIKIQSGLRVSEILRLYFDQVSQNPKERYSAFCNKIGLKIDSSGKLINRKKWLRHYSRELKVTTAFYIASRYSKPKAYWYALIIWLGFYKKKLRYRGILNDFLHALESKLINPKQT